MAFLLSISTTSIFTIFALSFFLYSLCFRILKSESKNKNTPPKAGGAWPVIGHLHLLNGPQPAHRTLGLIADKCGPIFTINLGVHRALVVCNSEIAKECLTTHDKVFATRPKTLAMQILGFDQTNFGFSTYDTYWRQIRKMATLELLSTHRLELLQNIRQSEVKTSIKELYKLWADNNSTGSNQVLVDMKRWFEDVTLNVILRMIVGKRYSGDGQESAGWKLALREFFELFGKFGVSDALPFLRWLDLGGDEKAMKKTAKELDYVLEEWLEEHKKKKKRSSGGRIYEEDFMDVMLYVLDDDTANNSTCLVHTFYHKDVDIKGQNFELIPFGSCRRMCPGVLFARQVLQLTLANLLHGFDFETPNNKAVDMTKSNGLTIIKETPLETLVTPRLEGHLYMDDSTTRT